MGKFLLEETDIIQKEIDGETSDLIKKEKWEEFNSTILGLGNLRDKSIVFGAICAIFDLEGFTNFCKQIDPHLSTPIFLSHFLDWFFQKIKSETKQADHAEGIETWHNLPILTKFLGDGVLVIWDIKDMDSVGQANIIISCKEICRSYANEFFPDIKRKVTEAPSKLRCGIAKGNIFSVGNANDFVGPCINFASRLQKLPGTSFAFLDRGFNAEENFRKDEFKLFVMKKIRVRGIGDSELVYILKSDYLKMSKEDKKNFLEP